MTENIERWLQGGSELVRVIPIMRRQQAPSGSFVTTTSLEIWEDGIRLHYVETMPSHSDPDSGEWDAWSVDDGEGTEFVWTQGGGGSGPGSRFYSSRSWEPVPAASAERVTIRNSVIGIDVTVPLDSAP